ncbi:YbaB/EbfC family nucleoid-associated protein [Granulicoccus phenolivorans]|uniref:YbaB/EbfC family nucleoid-associated protein n=1 Tax=Granulicoccus phenolivorans TaxID=266854 RepID=UPI000405BD8B|nr:hypothetical protein [Granulicoccus phenolivorans]
MSGFDHIFAELRAQAAAAPPPVPEVEAEGHSAEDLIIVRLGANQVTGVEVHPRALRLGTAELGDHIAAAVNAALADHTAKLVAAMQDADTDLGALQQNLDRIRTETQQSMQAYLGSMRDMLTQAAGQQERMTHGRDDRL